MNPGFDLGPLRIHYYGLILGLAIFSGYYFLRYRAKKQKVDLTIIDNLFLWSVPLAIIGARAYFVAFSWSQFSADFSKVFAIWEGGLAIHGAIIGGFLGATIALAIAKKNKLKISLGMLLDLAAPVLLLSQAIGRVGNYVNHEAFGGPTSLPWKIFIPPELRPTQFINSAYYHPTFAYEAIWNLLGVAFLLWLEKRGWTKKNGRGSLFALYVLWYSLGRFFIESLRTDSLYLGSLRVAQVISVLGVAGALFFLWYHKSKLKNVGSDS